MAAATSHARRRPGRSVRQARDASTTASSAKNAGTASSITWLEYFTVQVWTASHRPPTGETSASRIGGRDPERGVDGAGDVEVGLREVRRRLRRRRAVRDLGHRLERREREPRDDLRERRVLGPVVLAQEDPEVALLDPGRVQLAGAEVVVLVVVDREDVDGDEARRDRHDGDERHRGRDPESTEEDVPVEHERSLGVPGVRRKQRLPGDSGPSVPHAQENRILKPSGRHGSRCARAPETGPGGWTGRSS